MVKFKTALIRFHLSMDRNTASVTQAPHIHVGILWNKRLLSFLQLFDQMRMCPPLRYHMWVQSRSGKKICHTVPTCSVLVSYPTLWDPMDGGRQDPLSIGFSRQNYWSRLLFPPPGNLPDPGIEPTSPVSDIGRQILHPEPPGKPCHTMCPCYPLFTPYYHQTRKVNFPLVLEW